MINAVVSWIQARVVREDGQDLIEYSLLSGMIALAIIAVGFAAFGLSIGNMFTGIGNCVDFDGLNCS